jgi:hypothetical protein
MPNYHYTTFLLNSAHADDCSITIVARCASGIRELRPKNKLSLVPSLPLPEAGPIDAANEWAMLVLFL